MDRASGDVRLLEHGDRAAVLELMAEYPLQFPPFIVMKYPGRWEQFLEDGDLRKHGYNVAMDKAGNVIGHAGYVFNEEVDRYEIVGVVVKQADRQQGIGQALIESVCTRVAGMGERELFLYTLDHADNQAALRFYRSLGFDLARWEEDYFAAGFHRVTFVRELSGFRS